MANVSSGIRRKVDDLGRVVIPAGIRRSLNIREGDAVEVSVDGERVVLAKPRDACVFCGREGDDLHRFRNRLVCRECVATIGEVDGRLRTVAPAAPVATPDGPGVTPDPRPVTPNAGGAGVGAPPAATEPDGDAASPPAAEPPLQTEPPATWPTGPIDGDALARELASRGRGPSRAATSDGHEGDDEATVGPRSAPYDPASTTAW